MSKRSGYQIHVELVCESNGKWGYTYAMDDCGGSGHGGPEEEDALLKAHKAIRKELRRLVETKESKALRLEKARRVAALRKAKKDGHI